MDENAQRAVELPDWGNDGGTAPARAQSDPESGAVYCEECGMWLNGWTQFVDHTWGQKHKKNCCTMIVEGKGRAVSGDKGEKESAPSVPSVPQQASSELGAYVQEACAPEGGGYSDHGFEQPAAEMFAQPAAEMCVQPLAEMSACSFSAPCSAWACPYTNSHWSCRARL